MPGPFSLWEPTTLLQVTTKTRKVTVPYSDENLDRLATLLQIVGFQGVTVEELTNE